jgi:hypothetical protein
VSGLKATLAAGETDAPSADVAAAKSSAEDEIQPENTQVVDPPADIAAAKSSSEDEIQPENTQ